MQIGKTEIQKIKTHISYLTEFARQHKLPHSSVLIKIKHPTQLSCWRSGKFQQFSQVSPHPEQSIYVFLSSFDTFSSTTSIPTQN
jgi:hypothetical protein